VTARVKKWVGPCSPPYLGKCETLLIHRDELPVAIGEDEIHILAQIASLWCGKSYQVAAAGVEFIDPNGGSPARKPVSS
jgi:hypothetical protein